jgi:hypothetical protein
MTPLIKRIGHMPCRRDCRRGFAPGMTGLAAAMQQQDRIPALAEHVRNKLVAGGPDEGCGGGSEVPRHTRRKPKMITVVMKTRRLMPPRGAGEACCRINLAAVD